MMMINFFHLVISFAPLVLIFFLHVSGTEMFLLPGVFLVLSEHLDFGKCGVLMAHEDNFH